VRARWEESVAHEVRDAPPGRVAWRGDELPARDAALPTGRVEALKLTARGPEGGSSAFRFEPADSRFGGEVRFPFRNGEVVVPLRFERSWYAARQVERFELALPPGAVVERVEALESLPSVEALEPPDGARVSLSGPEPAFAHRVFPGVRFYRLVLDLPVMGEVSALYDAARVLGREPRDGDEVRRPVSHGASLVRGLELDLRQVDREKFRDFELTWRVEAVADPARPWVVLAESGPRRLRLVP
jgi:hypothetical protein